MHVACRALLSPPAALPPPAHPPITPMQGHTAAEAAKELVDEAVRLALASLRPGEADNAAASVFVFDEI